MKSEEQRLEPRRSNISFFNEKLSELLQRDMVILDYETADIDEESRTYKALVIFREPDSEKQYRALFSKEGDVFVTADTDIHTRSQAEKYRGRKKYTFCCFREIELIEEVIDNHPNNSMTLIYGEIALS